EPKHRPVRARPGSDTDGWNAKGLRHACGEIGRHSLEDDAERARLLELFGIRQDSRRLLVALALDLEAAHLVDELGRQSEVTHYGDAHRRQLPRDLDDTAAALQLHRVHAAFLDEASGAGDRLLD